MTAEVVNLRRARKAKARADKSNEAAANRLLHGQTGADRALVKLKQARVDKILDAHRLDTDGDVS